MRLPDRKGTVGVARQYRVGPNESPYAPPARSSSGVQVHGLGERHWSLLALLAEHGALHTGQVVTLLFGSRPAAVRHLGVLARAGLVWRFVYDDPPRPGRPLLIGSAVPFVPVLAFSASARPRTVNGCRYGNRYQQLPATP